MHDEIKHSMYMSLEILISACVIAVIALAGVISGNLMSIRSNEKASRAFLETQTQFYSYLNENGDIKGVDVVDCMSKYAKVYDFVVVFDKNFSHSANYVTKADGSKGWVETETNLIYMSYTYDKLEDWDVRALNSKMGNKIDNKFTIKQVLTPDGYSVQALIFLDNSVSSWSQEDINKIKNDIIGLHNSIVR